MKNSIKAVLITLASFVAGCGVLYLAAHFINWFIAIASVVLFVAITFIVKVELDEKDNEMRDYDEN